MLEIRNTSALVRSQPFAGTGRFLAGFFAFLSRWPVVNGLRVNGKEWFRTIITATRKGDFFSLMSFTT